MNYFEFSKHLEKGKFFNAYFFSGAEDYLLEQALRQLIKSVVDTATSDFNFDVFYGNEVDGGKIIDTANAYPMMAASRLVVVKEVQRLNLSSLELLSKYLEKPAPTSVMVLVSEGGGARNKFVTRIKKQCCCVEFKPLYENKIPDWIRTHLKKRGYEITQEAILFILSRVSNRLREVVNELNKIELNLNGKKKIELQDVNKIVGLSRNFNVFELTDALGYKNMNKSLHILNQMLESGESPTGILAMITRHFVNLTKLKGAVAQKTPKSELASLTGIPPYFIDKSLEMAKKFTFRQLQLIFEMLLEKDLFLKTSQQTPQIALQTLLIQIINQADRD